MTRAETERDRLCLEAFMASTENIFCLYKQNCLKLTAKLIQKEHLSGYWDTWKYGGYYPR